MRTRRHVAVWPLSVALLLAVCARSAKSQSVSMPDTAPSHFVAHVVSVCSESGVSPATGRPSWQVDLIVAIPPSTAGNAGVILGRTTPVFTRSRTGSLSATTPRSFVNGDELEVWRESSFAIDAVQSPRGTPTYTARRVVIRRRGRQKRSSSVDAPPACRFDSR